MAIGASGGLRYLLCALFLFPLAGDEPLSSERVAKLNREFDAEIANYSAMLLEHADDVSFYSRRGDAYFFRGQFEKAIADYDKMVELRPDLAETHWQRGLAYFYAGKYEKAADQFAAYHRYDNSDHENGVWHFFSLAKAHGIPDARKELFKYKDAGREPFPAIYRLVQGTATPEEVLSEAEAANLPAAQRDFRLFYAHLYIGFHYAILDKTEQARHHLKQAVEKSPEPPESYGSKYMWHVGRLQYDLLADDVAK